MKKERGGKRKREREREKNYVFMHNILLFILINLYRKFVFF